MSALIKNVMCSVYCALQGPLGPCLKTSSQLLHGKGLKTLVAILLLTSCGKKTSLYIEEPVATEKVTVPVEEKKGEVKKEDVKKKSKKKIKSVQKK